MKLIKYILLTSSIVVIAGFFAFAILDVPVEQNDIEIKIPASHFTK